MALSEYITTTLGNCCNNQQKYPEGNEHGRPIGNAYIIMSSRHTKTYSPPYMCISVKNDVFGRKLLRIPVIEA